MGGEVTSSSSHTFRSVQAAVCTRGDIRDAAEGACEMTVIKKSGFECDNSDGEVGGFKQAAGGVGAHPQ